VVLDGNPLDDIRQTEKVHMVMKHGELFDADLKRLWPDELGGPGGPRVQLKVGLKHRGAVQEFSRG